MPKYAPHMWEQAPQDLSAWIDDSVDWLYSELTSDGKAVPFSANVSEDKKLDYYRSRFFNPDGTPNEQARSEEYNRLGPQGYVDVLSALSKHIGQEPFVIGQSNGED